jgi:hypothetical protein
MIGFLWQSFGAFAAFQYSIVLAAIATIVLFLVRTREETAMADA